MTSLIADKPKLGFLISIALIYLIAIIIQQQLFLNWDVSTLLLASERLLKGGNYVNDFFTPNPPMIMYLYSIPLLFSKFSHLNIIYIFPLFVFLLASTAFYISYKLILTIYSKEDRLQAYIFLCGLLVVFLIIPLQELGQRDHLLVIMTFPYLLISTCRLENKRIDSKLAVFIGVFAGLAIALKPQFLILPCLIESYLLFKKRHWSALFKPELVAMSCVMITYLIIVMVTRQDYIQIMIPYLLKNYYHSPRHDLTIFLFSWIVNYSYAVIFLYVLLKKVNTYPEFSAILALGLIAYITTFLSQHYSYYYHQIPALSLAILLGLQLYVNIVSRSHFTRQEYKLTSIATVSMLIFICYKWYGLLSSLYFYPLMFFTFFAIFLFILLILLKPAQTFLLRISILAYIISMGYLISLIGINIFYIKIQLFSTALMILVLFCLSVTTSVPKIVSTFYLTLLGIFIFFIPASVGYLTYNEHYNYKNLVLNKLINFMHAQPPQTSIYTFSTATNYTFPLNYYTNAVVSQRFDCLWMILPILDTIQAKGDHDLLENIHNNHSKMYFLNMVIEDLKKSKPDLIFVEAGFAGQGKLWAFDYLHYFLQSQAFQEVWQNYQYLTTLEEYGKFNLQIYKRIDYGTSVTTLTRAHADA